MKIRSFLRRAAWLQSTSPKYREALRLYWDGKKEEALRMLESPRVVSGAREGREL